MKLLRSQAQPNLSHLLLADKELPLLLKALKKDDPFARELRKQIKREVQRG